MHCEMSAYDAVGTSIHILTVAVQSASRFGAELASSEASQHGYVTPRDVAARTVKAGDEAELDRVAAYFKQPIGCGGRRFLNAAIATLELVVAAFTASRREAGYVDRHNAGERSIWPSAHLIRSATLLAINVIARVAL